MCYGGVVIACSLNVFRFIYDVAEGMCVFLEDCKLIFAFFSDEEGYRFCGGDGKDGGKSRAVYVTQRRNTLMLILLR